MSLNTGEVGHRFPCARRKEGSWLASEREKMDCDLVLAFDNCVNPEHIFISLNSHLYNGAQNQLNLIERAFEWLT